MNKGNLYIISAPSGAGKTSLVKELISSLNSLSVSVSHTTRQKREGEIDGKDYFFISVEKFKMMQVDSAFLESAQVFDNFYGTAQKTVEDTLLQGNDVILEIDWQGAQQIRQLIPQAIWIFIFPPSIQALEERLYKRGQDDKETIAKRVAAAHIELQHAHEADFIVVNEIFADALRDLQAIVAASRLRASPMMARYPALVKRLGA